MKKVTFVFGKNENDVYPQYALGNVLITGVVGSGMSCMVQNILDSLILRYDRSDAEIIFWDHRNTDFVVWNHMDEGIRATAMCNWASSGESMAVSTVLRKLYHMFIGRKYFHDSPNNKPVIIFLTDMDSALPSYGNDFHEILRNLLIDGKDYGMYFVLTSQPSQTFLSRYVELVDHKVCLRVNNQAASEIMIETADAFGDNMPKYGKVWVSSRHEETKSLHVPMYSESKKKAICRGEILPHGVKFDENKLREFAILNMLK